MRYLATYLIYFAVIGRTLTWGASDSPPDESVMPLLGVYGLLIVAEPFLTRRWGGFQRVYLVLQTGLILGLLYTDPDLDFMPVLFLPLSFQAVSFFDRRVGFLWIGAFDLVMAYPLMLGWDWQLPGVGMVLLFGGVNFLMGGNAYMTQNAERTRLENQRLLGELEQANHQLQAQAAHAEELAVLQERSHMARELHDSVTQTIFSMNLTVQAASLVYAREPAQVAPQLERLLELARSAMAEMQVLMKQMPPQAASEGDLATALHRMVRERQAQDGLKIHLEISGDSALAEAVQAGLTRITQEALNNISKHAGTEEAIIRLKLAKPASLEVEDRGRGFEMGAYSPGQDHLGIAGMRERAAEIGWRLELESQPGQGTRVRVVEGAS